jgi:hypothetical protein
MKCSDSSDQSRTTRYVSFYLPNKRLIYPKVKIGAEFAMDLWPPKAKIDARAREQESWHVVIFSGTSVFEKLLTPQTLPLVLTTAQQRMI